MINNKLKEELQETKLDLMTCTKAEEIIINEGEELEIKIINS